MRILVTGGDGFIGGHLAESFLADGHDVTVFDNFEPFYAEGIKRHTLEVHRDIAEGEAMNYRFVKGDVRDPATVREVVGDVDVVVHQVAVNLVNQLRPVDDRISTTGYYPQHRVFDILYEELDRTGGTILLVLDEIDHIGSDDAILYENPRARSNGYLSTAKPGVIGISNDFGFRDDLSPKVKDSLCEEEIHFSPYNAPELRVILGERVTGAMYDDTVDDAVIVLFAAIAAQDTGSARQALDTLYKSGEIARTNGEERLTEDHVHQACEKLEQSQVEHGIRELTKHGHLALVAMLQLAFEQETPARILDVYPLYRRIAAASNVDPLVRRQMHDHLADLAMLGILDRQMKNKGRAGGHYYQYEFDVDLDIVGDVVRDFDSIALPKAVATRTT